MGQTSSQIAPTSQEVPNPTIDPRDTVSATQETQGAKKRKRHFEGDAASQSQSQGPKNPRRDGQQRRSLPQHCRGFALQPDMSTQEATQEEQPASEKNKNERKRKSAGTQNAVITAEPEDAQESLSGIGVNEGNHEDDGAVNQKTKETRKRKRKDEIEEHGPKDTREEAIAPDDVPESQSTNVANTSSIPKGARKKTMRQGGADGKLIPVLPSQSDSIQVATVQAAQPDRHEPADAAHAPQANAASANAAEDGIQITKPKKKRNRKGRDSERAAQDIELEPTQAPDDNGDKPEKALEQGQPDFLKRENEAAKGSQDSRQPIQAGDSAQPPNLKKSNSRAARQRRAAERQKLVEGINDLPKAAEQDDKAEKQEKSSRRQRKKSKIGGFEAEEEKAQRDRFTQLKESQHSEERGLEKGPWSNSEKALADKVFWSVCAQDKLSEHDLRMSISKWTQTNLLFKHDIYEVFPRRSIASIRKFCQRRFSSYERGAWTEEQDDALKKAYAANPDKWVAISEDVARQPGDCRDRYKHHIAYEDRELGPWSQDEEAKLVEAVKDCVELVKQQTNDDHVKNDPERLETMIHWKTVADRMGRKRNAKRCLEKWRILKKRDSVSVGQNSRPGKVIDRPSETGEGKLPKKFRDIAAAYAQCSAGDVCEMLKEIADAVEDHDKKFFDESTFWSVVSMRHPESRYNGTLRRRAFYGALETYKGPKIDEAGPSIAAQAEAVRRIMKREHNKGRLELVREYGKKPKKDSEAPKLSRAQRKAKARETQAAAEEEGRKIKSEAYIFDSDAEDEQAAPSHVADSAPNVAAAQNEQSMFGRMREEDVADALEESHRQPSFSKPSESVAANESPAPALEADAEPIEDDAKPNVAGLEDLQENETQGNTVEDNATHGIEDRADGTQLTDAHASGAEESSDSTRESSPDAKPSTQGESLLPQTDGPHEQNDGAHDPMPSASGAPQSNVQDDESETDESETDDSSDKSSPDAAVSLLPAQSARLEPAQTTTAQQPTTRESSLADIAPQAEDQSGESETDDSASDVSSPDADVSVLPAQSARLEPAQTTTAQQPTSREPPPATTVPEDDDQTDKSETDESETDDSASDESSPAAPPVQPAQAQNAPTTVAQAPAFYDNGAEVDASSINSDYAANLDDEAAVRMSPAAFMARCREAGRRLHESLGLEVGKGGQLADGK